MPTAVKSRTITLTSRGVEAVWRAVETLEITDPKRLASVLMEVASEEVERNSRFADRVRVLYNALTPAKPQASTRGRPKLLPADIKPIKHVEGRPFDIGAPPDPYFLLEIFGAAQLPRVLKLYSNDGLLEAVKIVQERNPAAKLKGKSKTKTVLVDFLVREVSAHK